MLQDVESVVLQSLHEERLGADHSHVGQKGQSDASEEDQVVKAWALGPVDPHTDGVPEALGPHRVNEAHRVSGMAGRHLPQSILKPQPWRVRRNIPATMIPTVLVITSITPRGMPYQAYN